MRAIKVNMPSSCSDPMTLFCQGNGKKALDALRGGATLCIEADGKGAAPCWHLEKSGTRMRHFPLGARTLRQLTVISKVASSPQDTGGRRYVFDSQKFEQLQQKWEYAQQCALDWNSKAGRAPAEAANLTPRAQATLRRLKAGKHLHMHLELADVLEELNSCGYLVVRPNGDAQLRIPAEQVKVPEGPLLRLMLRVQK